MGTHRAVATGGAVLIAAILSMGAGWPSGAELDDPSDTPSEAVKIVPQNNRILAAGPAVASDLLAFNPVSLAPAANPAVLGEAGSSLGAPSQTRAAARNPAPKSPEKNKTKRKHALSQWVMRHAFEVSRVIHQTGGYRYDGWNDCYGFVKRTWNPILEFMRHHSARGGFPTEMPVGDYPSALWHPIRSWNDLLPGDVLGKVQGHRGGSDVHYGLYGGKKGGTHYQFDNGGGAGPEFQPENGAFHYYYGPTHALLERYQ